MILKIIYGYSVKSGKPLVEIVNKAMTEFSILSCPGTYRVDHIPFMRFIPSWMPGGGFKKEAKVFRQSLLDMINVPFDLVKKQMVRMLLRLNYSCEHL